MLVAIAIIATMLSVTASFSTAYASTGMGNCKNSPDDCERQPDRVGNDDPNDTDADRDGPGGEDGDPTDDDTGEQNCWGKVSSGLAQKEDGKPGLGEHSSNPTPDEDNETPREGVGNQAEGHPSDHADTVGGFSGSDEDCVD